MTLTAIIMQFMAPPLVFIWLSVLGLLFSFRRFGRGCMIFGMLLLFLSSIPGIGLFISIPFLETNTKWSLDENTKKGEKVIYLSPKGKRFDQKVAKTLSKLNKVNILCGHFEGIDQRLLETRNIEEYSLGDFILSGGETASFVFIDALVRLLPGVLGNKDSIKEESFENDLLEHPQYTKPKEWEGKSPPEVLFSGDHDKIKGWRLSQSEAITRRQRPDLWKKYLNKKNEKH